MTADRAPKASSPHIPGARGTAIAIVVALSLTACRFLAGIDERDYSGTSASAGGSSSSSASTGGCGDTESDPHNCGTCNHDCLGGECAKGSCLPFLVSQTPHADQQQGLVADPGVGGYIYWGKFRTPGILFSAPKSGAAATTLTYVPDAGSLDELATDGTALYFSDYVDNDTKASRGVYSIQFNGAMEKQIAGGNVGLGANPFGASSVATNNGYVYYMNQYDELAIARVSIASGAVEPILQLQPSQGTPFYNMQGGLIVDDDWVYYGYVDSSTTGTDGVYRIRHDGTQKQLLFPTSHGLVRAVHNGVIYWLEDDGYMHSGPADGSGAAAILAKVESNLIFHGGYGYGQRGPNVIRFPEGIPLPPEELVWFGDLPSALTADSVSLIWVEHYTGDVYRLAF